MSGWKSGGQRGCLMHMVDDATTVALGRFAAEETIWAAAAVLRGWIEHYGGTPGALHRLEECVTCGRPTRRSGCAAKFR
jgi:hypothetical protein